MMNFDEKLKSENFYVSENNEKAIAVCRGAIENLDMNRKYHSIFIYGENGVGKTELLKIVENYLLEKYGTQKKVQRIYAWELVQELISSLNKKVIEEFHKKYWTLDVFIVDDVQFFANKTVNQEQFVFTLNKLKDRNALVIFASDKPVEDLKGFSAGLLTRFKNSVQIKMLFYDMKESSEKKQELLDFSLFSAITKNDAKDVTELLTEGANVNAKTNEGKTALMYAATEGNLDDVKLLLTNNANIDMKDKDDKSAKNYASSGSLGN